MGNGFVVEDITPADTTNPTPSSSSIETRSSGSSTKTIVPQSETVIANSSSSSVTALTLENNTKTPQETSSTIITSSTSSLLSATKTTENGVSVEAAATATTNTPASLTKFQNNTNTTTVLSSANSTTKSGNVIGNGAKNGLCQTLPPSPIQINDQENNVGIMNGGMMSTVKSPAPVKMLSDSLEKKFAASDDPSSNNDSKLIFVNQ